MRGLRNRVANRLFLAAMAVAGVALVSAAAAQDRTGAVVQSIPPPVAQNPTVPRLRLSDAQRADIQKALSQQHSEVSFGLKTAKAAENFEPSVGSAVPKSLKPHALPRPLIYEMPLLKRYTYLKFKHQVLIINPMNRKIVEVFPETNG
jgi:hypothetical protein